MTCSTQIDWCGAATGQSTICQNQGTCLNTLTNFTCRCLTGYTGDNCEILIDSCASQPCTRGTCFAQSYGYKCNCPSGKLRNDYFNNNFING